MNEDQARELAGEKLGIDVDDDHSKMVLRTPRTYPDGWLFVVNARAYIEGGDQSANIRGAGQLLVSSDGHTAFVGSGLDLGEALAAQTAKEAFEKVNALRQR